VFQVERLYFSFEEPVLRGLNLRVERGQIVGLVGPPAHGKSVLLRAIAGLLDVEAGSLRVFGKELVNSDFSDRSAIQSRIGMAFQNIALFDHMTVGENLAFPLRRLAQLEESAVLERVREELETVGLGGFEKRPVQGLSGGQKRRVGIARATITRPELLLFDEPAAGLDPVTSSRMFSLLEVQRRRLGATILVVSSDLDRLFEVVDSVCVLNAGRVLFQGRVEDALQSKSPPVVEFLEGIAPPARQPSIRSRS
jgi:phospholipid/cholesterol/gamma-HCH transport system ATP-binding protein